MSFQELQASFLSFYLFTDVENLTQKSVCIKLLDVHTADSWV